MSTFLIVDDSKLMRKMLRGIIVSAGHIVIGEASNGHEAFEQYRRLNPDFVTMDIIMDEVDGIQGLKLIKEYDADAIVIMCSAMGQECFIIEAIQAGAKEFIVKPFTQDNVLDMIENLRGKYGSKFKGWHA